MAILLPFDDSTAVGMLVNGGGDDYIAIGNPGDHGDQRGEELARLRLGLIHFPVAGDNAATFCGAHLLVRASTPGSFAPPRNSREAPPPVEM